MEKTKTISYLAILTALYVVLSAFVKFPLGIGNIQIDLGYIAFAVALCMFGVKGAVVGIVGCAIESILFSAYGFSIGWVVANTIIGLGCGVAFEETDKTGARIVLIILYCAIGLLLMKTTIECFLYSIPLAIKLPKSFAAFVVDSIAMIVGLLLYARLQRLTIMRNPQKCPTEVKESEGK